MNRIYVTIIGIKKKTLVRSGNNLDNRKNQELDLEPLKVQEVRCESTSQRRRLNKDVYFESPA